MVKLIIDQAEFIPFAMVKPLTGFPDNFLRKGHTDINIIDIQFDEIVSILEKTEEQKIDKEMELY